MSSDATELHAAPAKVLGDPKNAKPQGDATDAKHLLARADAVASERLRVTALSSAEIVAMTQLLVATALVVTAAIELFEASDAGAEKPEMQRCLLALAQKTRPFMEGRT